VFPAATEGKPETRNQKPETRNQKPETRKVNLGSDVQFLVSGFWFLVSGFWFLVSGFWFELASGRFVACDKVMRRFILAALFFALIPGSRAAEIALRQVASGLDSPVAMASAGDTRLFIVQQRGRIAIFDGTRVLAEPFLDVSSLVSCLRRARTPRPRLPSSLSRQRTLLHLLHEPQRRHHRRALRRQL
jgi:hypothetical protein